MSTRTHPSAVMINPKIIEEVHRLVDEHRVRIGLSPWDWAKRNIKVFSREHKKKAKAAKAGNRG